MIARTHDLAAITGLIAVVIIMAPLPQLSLATIIAALFANQLGGVAPDIDQPTAPLWRNLPIGGLFGRFFGKMLGGHRFLTHSLLGVALLALLAQWFLAIVQPIIPNMQVDIVWWAFVIGMVSHLIMDSFTKEGVPWLLPIPIKFGFPPVRRLRITTGKMVEKLIVLPVLMSILVVLIVFYYPQLLDLLHHRVIN